MLQDQHGLAVSTSSTEAAASFDRTLTIWDSIVTEYPTDVLAFRLAHFNNFWLGRREVMLASVKQAFPKWGRDMPGFGTVLSCRCFAYEECGDYTTAEPSGWAALEIDPADFWGHMPSLMSWKCKVDSAKASTYSQS
jgi:hypothetical protein